VSPADEQSAHGKGGVRMSSKIPVSAASCKRTIHIMLVGGLEHELFSIYWEESSQLTNIFQRGWNHQPVYTLCVDHFIPCESHSHKQRLTLFRSGLPHRLLKLNEINNSTFLCFHLQSKTSIWNYHSSETHISSYIIYPCIIPWIYHHYPIYPSVT
jgi:hypothetical protein